MWVSQSPESLHQHKLFSFFNADLETVIDAICVLSHQAIKAALAQVKAVADGGVTAADLTRAK